MFLRSAYVVCSLDNKEVFIAPTSFNASKDNTLEIGKGPSAVPGAATALSLVTAQLHVTRSAASMTPPSVHAIEIFRATTGGMPKPSGLVSFHSAAPTTSAKCQYWQLRLPLQLPE